MKRTERESVVVHKGKSKIWMGSILAALIAAVAVFAAMMQMEKSMLTQYAKGTILTASKEIPKGQRITPENIAEYFEEKELTENCIPESALTSMEQAVDKIPVAKIDSGTLLTTGMFREVNEMTKGMAEPVVVGFKAEDISQLVGGTLRAGDRIHIFSVNEEGETGLVRQDVFICDVFDQSGNLISNDNLSAVAQRVNVYLDKSEMETFYAELAKGSLRVVKVCE